MGCRVGQSSIQRSNLSGDPSSSLPGEEAALPASLAVELLPTVLPDLVAVLPVPAQAAHGCRGAAGRRSTLQVFFFQTYFWIFEFLIFFGHRSALLVFFFQTYFWIFGFFNFGFLFGRRLALQVFYFQTFTSPSLISDIWTQPWSSVTSFPK